MKRFLLLIATLMMVCATVAFAGGEQEATTAETAAEVFQPTGYPIVTQPVTLRVAVPRDPKHEVPYTEMAWSKLLHDLTGVEVDWVEFLGDGRAEKVNLMLASRELPDVILTNILSAQNLNDLVMGDDVVALNDLIDQYAPNWREYLETTPYARKLVTFADGNIYSLPYIREDPMINRMRDIMFINKVWLDRLGLEMPRTTEEFFDVMVAFKTMDPNGNNEADEIPMNGMFYRYANGSFFDLFPSFGGYESNNHIWVEDGEVYFSATRESSREGWKFMHRLYEAGAIEEEAMVQNYSQFIAKGKADPVIAGWFSAFSGAPQVGVERIEGEVYVPMPPLTGPNGQKPRMRPQANLVTPRGGTILKSGPSPEIAIRWLDAIAEPEISLQAWFGTFESPYGACIIKHDDGTYELTDEQGTIWGKTAPANGVPFLGAEEILSKTKFKGPRGMRAEYFYEVHQEYAGEIEDIFPPILIPEEQRDIIDEYLPDIQEYVQRTHARWMTEGNIDAEWDEFLAQLERMELAQVIDAYQVALDEFNAR